MGISQFLAWKDKHEYRARCHSCSTNWDFGSVSSVCKGEKWAVSTSLSCSLRLEQGQHSPYSATLSMIVEGATIANTMVLAHLLSTVPGASCVSLHSWPSKLQGMRRAVSQQKQIQEREQMDQTKRRKKVLTHTFVDSFLFSGGETLHLSSVCSS